MGLAQMSKTLFNALTERRDQIAISQDPRLPILAWGEVTDHQLISLLVDLCHLGVINEDAGNESSNT